ncbi:uncharacterized protein LOC117100462 [Anneissia japonica]|uniref:uncharacterized protein LOC117100462 n=1 Tax=Anneissia japonica TaxID=1529436 RepID=UPI00142554D4|nr:uncharacterized protein LOC117100462 [Anneissia japonica]
MPNTEDSGLTIKFIRQMLHAGLSSHYPRACKQMEPERRSSASGGASGGGQWQRGWGKFSSLDRSTPPSSGLAYLFFKCFGLTSVHCLNQAEIEAFEASASIEQNTGVAGFVEIVSTDAEHTINSNGVPDHDTPDYPTQHNPNDIAVQDYTFTFPINPTFAEEAKDLPMGAIGNYIYARHPDSFGVYHYHKMPSSCVFTVEEGVPSGIVGVARDGFPIYGPIDEDGTRLTSDDLDDCHGKMSSSGEYRYHTNDDFPYILGCFKGTVEVNQRPPGGREMNPGMNPDGGGRNPTTVSPNGGSQTSPSKTFMLFAMLCFFLNIL